MWKLFLWTNCVMKLRQQTLWRICQFFPDPCGDDFPTAACIFRLIHISCHYYRCYYLKPLIYRYIYLILQKKENRHAFYL